VTYGDPAHGGVFSPPMFYRTYSPAVDLTVDDQLRMEALRLAVESAGVGLGTDYYLTRAAQFAAFVLGHEVEDDTEDAP